MIKTVSGHLRIVHAYSFSQAFLVFLLEFIFGGYLILAILAVKAKGTKILVRQYHMQSLSEAQLKKRI